jgi:hypothetical protein
MMYRHAILSLYLQFVTIRHAFPTPMMAQFGVPRVYGSGLAIVRTLLEQPKADAENHLRVRAPEETELALLAQFMRHDSVASLAKAIAKHTGVRSGDLIAAAGLDPSRTDG